MRINALDYADRVVAPRAPAQLGALARTAQRGPGVVGRATDTALAVLMGATDVYDAAAGLTMLVSPETGMKMSEQAGSVRAFFERGLSPRAADALRKEFFTLGEKAAYRDPYALWLNVIRQVPNIGTVLAGGGAVGGAARLVGQGARVGAATAAGRAAAGAALGGGQGAVEAGRAVTPEAPAVQERIAAGQAPEDALTSARRRAAGIAAGIGAASGAVLYPLEAGLAARAFTGAGRPAGIAQRVGQALATGGKAAAIEGAQEGIEQTGVELGKASAGLPFSGSALGEAVVSGAFIGTGVPVVASGAGKAYRVGRKAVDMARPRAQPRPAPSPEPASAVETPPPQPTTAVETPPPRPAEARTASQVDPSVQAALALQYPLLFARNGEGGMRGPRDVGGLVQPGYQFSMSLRPGPAAEPEQMALPLTPPEPSPSTPPPAGPGALERVARPPMAPPLDPSAQAALGLQYPLPFAPGSMEGAPTSRGTSDLIRPGYQFPMALRPGPATEPEQLALPFASPESKTKGTLRRRGEAPAAPEDTMPEAVAPELAAVATEPTVAPSAEPTSEPDVAPAPVVQTEGMAPVTLYAAGPRPAAVSAGDPRSDFNLLFYDGKVTGLLRKRGSAKLVEIELATTNKAALRPLIKKLGLNEEDFVTARESNGKRLGYVYKASSLAGIDWFSRLFGNQLLVPPDPIVRGGLLVRRPASKAEPAPAAQEVEGTPAVAPEVPAAASAAAPPVAGAVEPAVETPEPAEPKRRRRAAATVAKKRLAVDPAVSVAEEDTSQADPGTPEAGVRPLVEQDEGATIVQRMDGSTELVDHFGPEDSDSAFAAANTVLASSLQGTARVAASLVPAVVKALPQNAPMAKVLTELVRRAGSVRVQGQASDAAGPAALYSPDGDLIVLDFAKIAPHQRVEVLAHELAHAVLHGAIATDKNVRALVEDAQGRVVQVLAAGQTEASRQLAESVSRASPQEFAAILMADGRVAEIVNSNLPRSLLSRLYARVAGALGLADPAAAQRVIRPMEWAAPNDQERQRLLLAAKAQGDSAPQTWTALAATLQAARGLSTTTKDTDATLPEPLRRAGLASKDRVRRLAIDALTVENIVDWFGERFGSEGKSALVAYREAVSALAHRANELIAETQAVVARLEDLEVIEPDVARDLATLMHDSTLYRLYPNVPFNDPLNSAGRQRPGAALIHADLVKRWAALPRDEHRELFTALRQQLTSMFVQHATVLVASVIRESVARYHKIDPASEAAYELASKTAEIILSRGPLGQLPPELQTEARTSAVVRRMVLLMSKYLDPRTGPYFPLLRTGRYFVIAGDPEFTSMTLTREQWENSTDPWLNVKPDSTALWSPDGSTVDITARRYAVISVDSEAEARSLVLELEKDFPGKKPYYLVRDEYLSALRRQLPAEEMERIIEAATEGLSQDAARAVTDNLLELFSSRLPAGNVVASRITRNNVMGASRNMAQASMRAAATMARVIARLEYTSRKRNALERLVKIERDIAARDPAEGVVVSEVRQSLQARDELADILLNPYLGSAVLNKIGNLTATAFLTNAATVLVNLTQSWMVSFPVMAGRYGATVAGETLSGAMTDIVRGTTKAMGDAYTRVAKGLHVLPPGKAWHDYMLYNLSPDELAMIDALVKRNRLDFTMADDLIEMTDPLRGPHAGPPSKIGETWRKVQDFLFVAPRVSEAFNRVATALAGYRLARQAGLDHEAAVVEADDMVRLTHFNYENYNKSRFFMTPYLRPALVFKQYIYGLVYLQSHLLRQAFQGDTPQARQEAAKALGIFYTLLFAAAGALGSVPEPLWIALNLVAKLFGMSADEMMRRGMVALVGEEMAPWALRGSVANLLNIDLQRLSIAEMLLPREVWSAQDSNDWLKAALSVYFGAPGGVVSNIVDGMGQMMDGQYLRGLGRAFPIRTVASPIQAIDWMANGYTDRSGKPIMTPDEVGWWSIGVKAVGFSPLDISERGEMAAKVTREVRSVARERQRIYRDFVAAAAAGEDVAPVIERVASFNERNPSAPIDGAALRRSVREQLRARARLRMTGTGVANRTGEAIARDLVRLYRLPAVIERRLEGARP